MNEITQVQELRNPTLTLYAFHLRSSISEGMEKTVQEADRLWEQIVDLGQTLHIPELQNLRRKLICYQGNQYSPAAEDRQEPDQLTLLRQGEESLDFRVISHEGGTKLNGSLCPFRLHDSYAVDLTLKYEGTLTLGRVGHLNPQGCLLPPHIQASLGQTLLLFAEPTQTQDNYQVLADACVAQLLHGTASTELVTTGRLLDSPIFEYDNWETNPAQKRHILIWLNCQSTTSDRVDRVLEPLFYLLWCRHKIFYAYHQSRWCDRQAKQLYSTIEQYMQGFSRIANAPNRLQQFQELLTQLPQMAFNYARYLRDLQDHETTITTNIDNYSSQMAKLRELPESDPIFWQQFLDRAQSKFQRQIEVDQHYLTPGRELFQELLATIRSIVAIDQVESDRQFQLDLQQRDRQFHQALQTQEVARQESLRQQEEEDQKRDLRLQLAIAFFGFGFAVSGISSQVNPTPLETILGKSPPSEGTPWTATAITVNILDIAIHITIGILAGLVAALLLFCKQRKS